MRSRLWRTAAVLGLVPPALVGASLAISLRAVAQEKSPRGEVKVRWFGQACFELDFPTGLVALVDPFGDIGSYRFPKDVKPDVVTISHEHFDHNNDKDVSGSPQILRGLTSADKDKQDWKKTDLTIKGVHIRSVGVYHDEKNGAERGKNSVFVFEPVEKDAFATIAHLGDLGHQLTAEQLAAIGPVDAVLVPVGGHFTIDAAAAKKVCDALKPAHFVAPMHYKTPALKPEIPIATADAFLELWPAGHVERVEGNETAARHKPLFSGVPTPRVLVLGYEPKGGAMKEEGERVGDAKGKPSVKIVESRAWGNTQGPTPGRLHFSLTIEVSGGSSGGTLSVLGGQATEANGVAERVISFGPEAFEDDDGKAAPKDGWTLAPGETRTLKLVGERPGGSNRLDLRATFTPKSGKPMSDEARPSIQDVR
jgi:L-ascorbate metabolism protein UlaG (beta-lactamase superfamily)